MTFLFVPFLAAVSPLTLWVDPERTLRMDSSKLPSDLRSLAESAADHERLLARLAKSPEDWRVQMIVRGEVARSGSVAFAKKAVDVAGKSVLQFMPLYPNWYRRQMFFGALAHACYRYSSRGTLRADQATMDSWYRDGQLALEVRIQDLKSSQEALLPLSLYWNNPFKTNEGRAFLTECRRRFKLDAGLAIYTARLYDAAVAPGWTYPSDGRAPYKNSSFAAKYDPERVRRAALFAWGEMPHDPGVLAVAAGYLAEHRDPKAEKAYQAYRLINDPEPDRRARVEEIRAQRKSR